MIAVKLLRRQHTVPKSLGTWKIVPTYQQFSTTKDDETETTTKIDRTGRREHVKGAMGVFAKKISARRRNTNASPSEQVWAELRREITPASSMRSQPHGQQRNDRPSRAGMGWSGARQRDGDNNQDESTIEHAMDDSWRQRKSFRAANTRNSGGGAAGRRSAGYRPRPRPNTTGGGDGEGDSGGGRRFRRSRGRDRGDGEDGGRAGRGDGGGGGMGGIPPAIEFLLRDHEYFAEVAAQGGKSIDTSRMDDIDEWMATAFFESLKSGDSTFSMVHESPSLRRSELPKPRSMAQLQAFMQAPLLPSTADASAEHNSAAQSGSAGEALAQEAWQVINKNFYYTDSDKQRMAEHIMKIHNRMQADYDAQIAEAEESGFGVDLIFRAGFNPGREYYEEEKRLLALEGTKPVDDSEFVQEETNWDVEAVEDEDQL